MSWNEQASIYGYFYPVYDFSMMVQLQMQCLQMPTLALTEQKHNNQENIENQKIQDLQHQPTSIKNPQQYGTIMKRKSNQKMKLLRRLQREDNFSKKKQKKDRNIPSNIFKMFIVQLYSDQNLKNYLSSLEKKNININANSFMDKIKRSIKLTQSYIRPSTIQKLCGDQILTKQESLAFRMLIKKFLLLELPLTVAPIKKYRISQKREIIGFGKKLFESLKQRVYQ